MLTPEQTETYQRESNQRAGYDPEREGVTVVAWCIHRQQDETQDRGGMHLLGPPTVTLIWMIVE